MIFLFFYLHLVSLAFIGKASGRETRRGFFPVLAAWAGCKLSAAILTVPTSLMLGELIIGSNFCQGSLGRKYK
jgi:hypothetical protein